MILWQAMWKLNAPRYPPFNSKLSSSYAQDSGRNPIIKGLFTLHSILYISLSIICTESYHCFTISNYNISYLTTDDFICALHCSACESWSLQKLSLYIFIFFQLKENVSTTLSALKSLDLINFLRQIPIQTFYLLCYVPI